MPKTNYFDEPAAQHYDETSAGMISHHYAIDGGQVWVYSVPFRYVWPAELDLMARLAGTTRRARWDGWKGEPFTSDSRTHVSVWEKPVAVPFVGTSARGIFPSGAAAGRRTGRP